MQFTYTYLKNAAERKLQVGGWRQYSVYAARSSDLDRYKDKKVMFILYDDHNYLYYDGLIYGTIDEHGSIDEWDKPKPYKTKPKEIKVEVEEYKSETIGDVNLEIEVDKMLKTGRGITVEELLKGFDYGLRP